MTLMFNKTDAGNGLYGICRVIDASCSPSPDPKRWLIRRKSIMKREPQHHRWKWCPNLGVTNVIYDVDYRCECNAVPESMPFIRQSWLLEQGTNLGNMPRMQSLPTRSFIFPEEMDCAYFISHRWLANHHPDPSGGQLAVALSRMWSGNTPAHYEVEDWSKCEGVYRSGIWYDYLCLPQPPFGDFAEMECLRRLLPVVFCLPRITIPLLVVSKGFDLASRAWCVAECAAAFYNKSGMQTEVISLSGQMVRHSIEDFSNERIATANLPYARGRVAGISKMREWLQSSETVLGDILGFIREVGAEGES